MDIQDFINKLGDVFEDTDLSSLKPETNFRNLEEWSSITALSLIAFADEEFNKELSGAEIRNAHTLQDLYDLIAK